MLEVLQDTFGFNSFRPLQKEIIDSVLQKRDILSILPTGAGKSLCYQLPAILSKTNVTIVISPLIALIDDQVDKLKKLNINADKITSMQDAEEIKQVYYKLYNQEISLLYISPERILLDSFQDFLLHIDINFFVIDEAHCVSDWGHEFRPDYRKLNFIKEKFPNTSICAFTATANNDVQKDIINTLQLENPIVIKDSFLKENLFIKSQPRVGNGKGQILSFINQYKNQSGIIYTFTRSQTEEISSFLNENSIKALPYHAGLDKNRRTNTQQLFIEDEVKIVVATIAFGMGIDKSNIRFIIHVDLPKSMESYYQEIGRAGRDGKNSVCLMLYNRQDLYRKSDLLNKIDNTEYKTNAKNRINTMYHFATTNNCRHQVLLEYFDEKIKECKNRCDNCTNIDVIDINEEEVFDRLRDFRKKIAQEKNIAINKVLSDDMLKDIAKIKPQNKKEFLTLKGIGLKKYESFGEEFISFIKQLSAYNIKDEILISIKHTKSIKTTAKHLNQSQKQILKEIKKLKDKNKITQELFDKIIDNHLESIPDNIQKWYMQGLSLVKDKKELKDYIEILNEI
jgi:ATP-dependent DNA helicase RecQ